MIPIRLIELCQELGRLVPCWTQGSGSNLSYKKEGKLWIKASGCRLDEVTEKRGLAKVDLLTLKEKLAAISRDGSEETQYAQILGQCSEQAPHLGRASMETGFHALLSGDWVLHVHSLPALLMGHQHSRNEKTLSLWFKRQGIEVPAFLPPLRPGLLLSEQVASLTGNPPIIILKNHGLILNTHTLDLVEQWQKIEQAFCDEWNYGPLLVKSLPFAPTPLKIYFPDAAVFIDRLKNILTPVSDTSDMLYVPAMDLDSKDLDALEIWQATDRLYRSDQSLSELPDFISSTVAALPTEQFRKGLSL